MTAHTFHDLLALELQKGEGTITQIIVWCDLSDGRISGRRIDADGMMPLVLSSKQSYIACIALESNQLRILPRYKVCHMA